MSAKNLLILLTVTAYVLICPVLVLLRGEAESVTFHAIHSLVAAVIILYLNAGEKPAPRPLGFFSRVLFILGAMYIGALLDVFYRSWTGAEAGPGTIFTDLPFQTLTGLDRELHGPFSTLVVAPLFEEIICRLGLLGVLTRMTNRTSALVISSLLFAELHFAARTQLSLVPLFMLGVLLGLTWLMLGLRWAMALHLLWNLNAEYGRRLIEYRYLTLGLSLLCLSGVWIFISSLIRYRRQILGRSLAS